MERKYELLEDETVDFYGKKLYRIRATESFGAVTEGEKGGFVESYNNLDGDAWVAGDAKVYDNAKVYGNACVAGDAKVCDNAKVYGNAMVRGDAWVAGDAMVCGNAKVCDNAIVCGNASVGGNAKVSGNAYVACYAEIDGNAQISDAADILTVSPVGFDGDSVTFFKCGDSSIRVITDEFRGTIDEFSDTVAQEYGDSEYAQEYKLAIQLAKLKIKVEEESK